MAAHHRFTTSTSPLQSFAVGTTALTNTPTLSVIVHCSYGSLPQLLIDLHRRATPGVGSVSAHARRNFELQRISLPLRRPLESCPQDERLATLLCAPIFYALACLHGMGFFFVYMLPMRPIHFHGFSGEASWRQSPSSNGKSKIVTWVGWGAEREEHSRGAFVDKGGTCRC